MDSLTTARTLVEALPYMRKFSGHTFVIKFGGHAMGSPELSKLFARDVVLLKQIGINPVIVHGGGPQIGAMLKRLDVESSYIDGLRVTDEQTIDVVEMVLAGSINKEIVQNINHAGGTSIGICGKDGNLIRAKKLTRTRRDTDSNIESAVDLGFVGEPEFVNPRVLTALESTGMIPVIAPIGMGADGQTYNINADTAAGAIASALGAARLLMLTDVKGVLDKDGQLMTAIDADAVPGLIADETISGGMIPKVQTCVDAVNNGVGSATILDGRQEHAMLLEVFTETGSGTWILPAAG
jgi:acetylglutamate kinase